MGWSAEPYTTAFVVKSRSGGAATRHIFRSGSSSTGNHILFTTTGPVPNARHEGAGGSVTISGGSMVNDTTWHTLLTTWCPHFFGLYLDGNLVASSTAANTATSTAWSIFRFGWGFSTNQDFNGDIALIACFAASWTAAMIRRWNADPFGFLRPWNEVPPHGQRATIHAPLDRRGRGRLPDGVASKALRPGHPAPGARPAWWSASPLGMLWPEVDAAFVMSRCGGLPTVRVGRWSSSLPRDPSDGAPMPVSRASAARAVVAVTIGDSTGLEASNLHLMSIIGGARKTDLRIVAFLK